jgi:hypothetical protein
MCSECNISKNILPIVNEIICEICDKLEERARYKDNQSLSISHPSTTLIDLSDINQLDLEKDLQESQLDLDDWEYVNTEQTA